MECTEGTPGGGRQGGEEMEGWGMGWGRGRGMGMGRGRGMGMGIGRGMGRGMENKCTKRTREVGLGEGHVLRVHVHVCHTSHASEPRDGSLSSDNREEHDSTSSQQEPLTHQTWH